MKFKSCPPDPLGKKAAGGYRRILLMAKLTAILLLCFCLKVTASSGQQVTLNVKNASLESVLREIKKQTGYNFLYKDEVLEKAVKVTVSLKNASLQEALEVCFKNQPLTYQIAGKGITIKERPFTPTANPQKSDRTITGRITDTTGVALPGATVNILGMERTVITDGEGRFLFNKVPDDAILVISYVGYRTIRLPVSTVVDWTIKLAPTASALNEVVVIPYGATTRRLVTGSIGKVTAKDIASQPVMNPLAALAGRVAGLNITQSTGLPGGSFSVNIRGRTSINANISNDPLFIIDGVPLANNNNDISNLGSAYTATGGLSPLTTINPADIESIEVLKDADATSIYGSRGANGVILITTKKGKEGKTAINATVYTGISKATRVPQMMNTQQYLQMRKEAFKNDGQIPDQNNAYDLLAYDTTRYTNWGKYLIGNSAHTTDANISASGGSHNTQFFVGGGYHRETTVSPGGLADGRASAHFNINHQSSDNKFLLNFSGSLGTDRNHNAVGDLSNYLYLPPNTPGLTNQDGSLIWAENGAPVNNPLSGLYQKYRANTDNYIGNLQLVYKVTKNLSLKNGLGYNAMYIDEFSSYPIAAQDPAYGPVGYATFSNSNFKSLIVEPQIEWTSSLGGGKLTALAGGSWQHTSSAGSYIYASGYSSDLLLESLGAASTIDDKGSTSAEYKYAAAFGRINYNWKNKYLLNLTGRRDGSSRFGPRERYANFGAVGAAWIFTEEQWLKKSLPALSFGKLRASYGTSGNDKIGDYNYLDTWTALSRTYQGQAGLNPTRLFNPDYRWEINKKLEVGLELGFFSDRILFTGNWYRNRSSNQLIQYTLPYQTGGGSITANFPATVQNTGLELQLNTVNVKSGNFEWSSTFNITIPQNKLIAFPNIEQSSYNSRLIVGRSLSIVPGLVVSGVNAQTGVYEIVDQNGALTSMPLSTDVRKGIADLSPKCYGGLGNSLKYRGFQLDAFFEFKRQTGRNYLGNLADVRAFPGMLYNFPVIVQDRWTPDHPQASLQQYTQSTSSAAYTVGRALTSNGTDLFYSDASYIRLKTLALSYVLPQQFTATVGVKGLRLYMNAQNLLTITGYKVGDPETQNFFRLPPLRTITFGLQATL